MPKFKMPEILLGVFMAIAAFSIGATVYPILPIHGATNEQANKTPKEESDDRIAFYTEVLAWFTGILAISTIGLWVVTWRSGIRQSRDMKGAIAAAREANAISQQGIIADQRAWITVGDLQFDSDLVFIKGRANFGISVKITNIGKTPAHKVHTHMDLIYDYDAAINAVRSLSESEKLVDVVGWTRTLLPGDSYRRNWGFTLQTDDPKQLLMFPVIIGCTTYRISPDDSLHQTAFVLHVFECKSGSPSDFAECIRPWAGILPKDRIGWDGGSGAFAN